MEDVSFSGGESGKDDEGAPAATLLARSVGRMKGLAERAAERAMSVAEESLELAAQVAAIEQRAEAFGAVFDVTQARKDVLTRKLREARGPAKVMLERQLRLLEETEQEILRRAGGGEKRPGVAQIAG